MSRPKQIQTEEDLKRISDIVNINSVKIIKDFRSDVKDFNIITGNSLNNEEKIFFIQNGKIIAENNQRRKRDDKKNKNFRHKLFY